jgi:hypothetical protein
MDNGGPPIVPPAWGIGVVEQHCLRSTRPLQMRSYVRQLPVCRMIELNYVDIGPTFKGSSC